MPSNADKTVCIHGHALTPDNVRLRSEGWRACRVCDRERVRTAARHRYPDPRAVCGHRKCGRILSSHGPNERCPFNDKLRFHKVKPHNGRTPRAPFSLNGRHLDAVTAVLAVVQRGGDPRVIAATHRAEIGRVLGMMVRAQKRLRNRATSSSDADAAQAATSHPAAAGVLEGVAASYAAGASR